MRAAARAIVVLASLGALGGAAFGFAPLVRSRIASVAARRQLVVEIGSVRPGWFAITLRDVHVHAESIHGVAIRLDEVRVDVSSRFAVERVGARGGAIEIHADPDVVAREFRDWRDRTEGSSGGKSNTPVEVRLEAASLSWSAPDDPKFNVDLRGMALTRDGGGVRVAVEGAKVQTEAIGIIAASASVDLDRGEALRGAHLASLDLDWSGGGEPPRPDVAIAPSGDPSAPAPPPLPNVSVKKAAAAPSAAKAAQNKPPADEESKAPLFALPDLHATRAKIAKLAGAGAARFPESMSIAIDGLSVVLVSQGQRVVIGPAPLRVNRQAGRFVIAFASATEEGAGASASTSTPLSVNAEIPVESGDVVLSLAGGPVALSLLGVKEGAAGLVDVAKTTVAGHGRVVLADAADALTFDIALETHNLAVAEPRIALDIVRGLDLGVSARGMVSDRGELRLDDAEGTLGALHAGIHGSFQEAGDHSSAAFNLDVPVASCQALLESVPAALLPVLNGARMSGTFGARARVAFDSRKLDDLVLDYAVDDRCTITDAPAELSRDRFSGSFTHRIYHPDGKLEDETTGPGTANWTDLSQISPFMQIAVLTTEDGAFFKHHGFNHNAIRNAVVANLKAHHFVRGASTITMQLAKNLFLTREKTLSRKLEEMILTDYLEQVFHKDDMMELYLNIIEFGPDIYGVTHASDHYFGRKPDELNLAEALFLSSIMPSPLRYHRLYERGEVPEYWMKHIHELMEIAARNGKISREELAVGLTETIVFHKEGAPPPEPRPPASASFFASGEVEKLERGEEPSPSDVPAP